MCKKGGKRGGGKKNLQPLLLIFFPVGVWRESLRRRRGKGKGRTNWGSIQKEGALVTTSTPGGREEEVWGAKKELSFCIHHDQPTFFPRNMNRSAGAFTLHSPKPTVAYPSRV